MSFEILKEFNPTTKLIMYNGEVRILKRITEADVDIYEKVKEINCPNLPLIYEIIRENGEIFVVREYVNGETLESCLEKNGNVKEAFAKKVAISVCDALIPLHKFGIVHRDVSPKNIILGTDEIKLIDFDISRTVKADKSRDTEILGTQGYAAPEQFGFYQTGPKADIYSVGVLINFMLTGKLPNEELASGELKKVIVRCIHLDEKERFNSAVQLKNAINKKGVRYILSNIPGFRTNKLYKKIIATLYYIFVIIFSYFYLGIPSNTALEIFEYIWFIIFFLIAPVLLICNQNNYIDRLAVNSSRTEKNVLKILFAAISAVISVAPIIIIS